ncbi:MAG TPA: phytanoyl-CoA dioxygenase family protein [Terriglobia bacterium]|nr:phytanoyl-CoA dioxygenase family protein [Terriglobia bacterium]
MKTATATTNEADRSAINGPLQITETQKDLFRRHGYVHLKGFFTPERVEALRQLSDQLSAQALAILRAAQAAGESLSQRARNHPLELIVLPEASNPAQVCRYEFMIGSNTKFRDFTADYVQPAVSAVAGKAVRPFKDKTNEKLPGGGAFRPHQDFAAYQFFKARYHVTAQLSVDAATVENGCVQFSPNFGAIAARRPEFVVDRVDGRALLHSNDGGPHHGDLRADIAAELHWQPLESAPADLVIFDSFVPHWSDINRSSKPRRAIFITFNLASEGSLYDEYYADKRLNYDDPKFHVSTPTLYGKQGNRE